MAARVSPPPAIENAGLSAIALATTRVPCPNWSNSKTPSGPFQTIVPAPAMTAATDSAASGPISRIISSSPTSSTRRTSASAVAASSFATTTSAGSGISVARSCAFSSNCLAVAMSVGSYSDLPTARPLAAMNVFAIPPPTIRRSTFSIRVVRTSSLVDTLAPPTTATSGRSGAKVSSRSLSVSAPADKPPPCRLRP